MGWPPRHAGVAMAPPFGAAPGVALADQSQSSAAADRPRLVLPPLKRRLLEASCSGQADKVVDECGGGDDEAPCARRVRLSCAAVVEAPLGSPGGCAGGVPSPPASPTRSRLLDLDALPFVNRRLRAPVPAARRAVAGREGKEGVGCALSAAALAQRVVDTLLATPGEWAPPADRDFFLSPAELCTLCDAAQKAFAADSSCVRTRAPTKIFGDVHGQFGDLLRLFDAYGAPTRGAGGDAALVDYLFLGDYVDRGEHSLEVVALLFALKVLNPRHVNLVRGNHESRDVNAYMGLLDECEERLSGSAARADEGADDGRGAACGQGVGASQRPWFSGLSSGETAAAEAWERINDVFDHLPLAALIEGKILCVHGGLGSAVKTVEDIDTIQRPISVDAGGQLLTDLLWSDPTDNDSIKGVIPNPRRGADVVAFGPDVVDQFCARNGIEMIVRAHECVMDGIERFAGGRLVTVFSAANYCGVAGNAGAALLVDRELQVQPLIVQPPRAVEPNTPDMVVVGAATATPSGDDDVTDSSDSDSEYDSDELQE